MDRRRVMLTAHEEERLKELYKRMNVIEKEIIALEKRRDRKNEKS